MSITANEKYAKRGQALITKGDLQRLEEVAAANRNKTVCPSNIFHEFGLPILKHGW